MPDACLTEADAFFPTIGMKQVAAAARSRTFEGVVGEPEEPVTLTLTVRMEGGHYTFVEAHTTAQGESRLDRNVKKYFVRLHRQADAHHALSAAY
jgi:ketosteroid isomerase-like protein